MKNRPRAVWLALAAGALLVTLSVSSAFGADPADDERNHGQQVSDFVHSLLFGDPTSNDEDEPVDEETQEDEETAEDEEASDEEEGTEDEEATDEESADGPPDNHGQCVRVVAMGTDTGGSNDNHGGAVSEAARVTCWEDSEGGEEDSAESTEGAQQRGNSANAHDKPKHGHGNPHND